MKNDINKLYQDTLYQAESEFKAKLREYGASFMLYNQKSLTDQILIKAHRIRHLQTGASPQVQGEENSIRKEFIAIFNYGCIKLMRPVEITNISKVTEDDINELECAYTEVVDKCHMLASKKNADYNNAWLLLRPTTFADIIYVKLARLRRLEETGGDSERMVDNVIDIINYAVYAIIKNSPTLGVGESSSISLLTH